VVALEGLLEFIPSNSMSSLLHGLEMFPPHQGFTRSYKAAKLAFFPLSMAAQRRRTWPQWP
jgi:hypothetical protein